MCAFMNLNEVIEKHRLDPDFAFEFVIKTRGYTTIIVYSQTEREVVERINIARVHVDRFVMDVLDAYSESKAA